MSGRRVLRDEFTTQTTLRLLENARYEVLPTADPLAGQPVHDLGQLSSTASTTT